MRTQREIIRMIGLVLSVHLLVVFSLLGAAQSDTSKGLTDSVPDRTTVRQTGADSINSRPTTGLNHEISQEQEPFQSQWQQCCMIYWDLFEEESQCQFNPLQKTAPHILFSLSGLNSRASARMQLSGHLPKIYLLNSSLRC
jgi:hypothetical protein